MEVFADPQALGAQCSSCMFPTSSLHSPLDLDQAGTDHAFADGSFDQLSRSRTLATVTDDPLSKKVEMTNLEQVRYRTSRLLYPDHCGTSPMTDPFTVGKLYQLQVCRIWPHQKKTCRNIVISITFFGLDISAMG